MDLTKLKQINWREPRYMLPAILYPLLLGAGWLLFDLFDTGVAEKPTDLQTTEYLNPDLPEARLRDGKIGSKYENMTRSYGKIQDYSAVENIDRNEAYDTEEYDSRYTDQDMAMIDAEAARRLQEIQDALDGNIDNYNELEEEEEYEEYDITDEEARLAEVNARNEATFAELQRALAEARLQGQQRSEVSRTTSVEINADAVNVPDDNATIEQVAKAVRPSSTYFNTLAENEPEPRLIQAIIDEDIKAVDGSRVRLRLLDDVEIGGVLMEKGSYLYATMSGFGQQRVKGTVKSLMVNDEILKVSLSIYDVDGLEGLYVPASSFRETSQDMASGAMNSNVSLNNGSYNNSFSQWGMQAIQNAYQQASNAISRAIRKNKANLKYGTFVYLVNSREQRNNRQ